MELSLDDKQAEELRRLLTQVLGDLSSEIAATDNPEFRRSLRERRDLLHMIGVQLESAPQEAIESGKR
jgi:hypothetical protein